MKVMVSPKRGAGSFRRGAFWYAGGSPGGIPGGTPGGSPTPGGTPGGKPGGKPPGGPPGGPPGACLGQTSIVDLIPPRQTQAGGREVSKPCFMSHVEQQQPSAIECGMQR
jgi:hypothetical protein